MTDTSKRNEGETKILVELEQVFFHGGIRDFVVGVRSSVTLIWKHFLNGGLKS